MSVFLAPKGTTEEMLLKLRHLWWTSKEKGRGRDNNIRIGVDIWGFEGLNGNSLCYHMSNISEKMVRDLWVPNSFAWNKDWVCELYGELVWDRICDLSIISNGLNDKVIWFHNIMVFFMDFS